MDLARVRGDEAGERPRPDLQEVCELLGRGVVVDRHSLGQQTTLVTSGPAATLTVREVRRIVHEPSEAERPDEPSEAERPKWKEHGWETPLDFFANGRMVKCSVP